MKVVVRAVETTATWSKCDVSKERGKLEEEEQEEATRR